MQQCGKARWINNPIDDPVGLQPAIEPKAVATRLVAADDANRAGAELGLLALDQPQQCVAVAAGNPVKPRLTVYRQHKTNRKKPLLSYFGDREAVTAVGFAFRPRCCQK